MQSCHLWRCHLLGIRHNCTQKPQAHGMSHCVCVASLNRCVMHDCVCRCWAPSLQSGLRVPCCVSCCSTQSRAARTPPCNWPELLLTMALTAGCSTLRTLCCCGSSLTCFTSSGGWLYLHHPHPVGLNLPCVLPASCTAVVPNGDAVSKQAWTTVVLTSQSLPALARH